MKRFYREVTVAGLDTGFGIFLDGRVVKTPDRKSLALPNAGLAELIAAEWRAAAEEFDPAAMQLTKCANTAQDRVLGQEAAVAESILAFANDLLCYRADHPDALVVRQREKWDPLLVWFESRFGVALKTGVGVVPFDQPAQVLTVIRAFLAGQNVFFLSALHGAAALTGSLVLSLAIAEGKLTADEAFVLSRLDDEFQAERWGRDREADERAAALRAELAGFSVFLLAAAA